MGDEMDSIARNKFGNLFILHLELSLSKQVGFKIKHQADRSIDNFKTRLITKSFAYFNYEETFSMWKD